MMTIKTRKLKKEEINRNKKKAFEILATSVIKDLEKRNMEGYYFEDSKSCVEAILKMIPKQNKKGEYFKFTHNILK